jgi:CHASE3 domain sensor protein
MQFFYKEQKVRNGYITAFGLLMASYLMVFVTIHQMEKRAGLVDHTNEIISNLDILLTCIKDSETSYRGYIIMQDTPSLNAYGFHTHCINSSFDTLKKLFAGDPEQNLSIDSLYNLVILKRNLISLTMDDIQKGSQPEKNILNERIERGREFIMEIRTLVYKMQTHEKERLAIRTKEFESISRTLKIIHFTSFILALMLVTYSMIVFNNVNNAKRQYRVQLEEGIEKMKIVNTDLINLRSIEKFAASGRIAIAIAHEVRNPLTSISLAAEQLGPAIKTEEETTLLEIITRNVNRIHDLVLDLLNSTKFSHLELSKMSLNTLVDQALELAKDRIELNAIMVIKNFSPNP